MFVCGFACLCVWVWLRVFACVFDCLFVCDCLRVAVCLCGRRVFVYDWVAGCLFVCLYVCLLACVLDCVVGCLFARLVVCLFVRLLVCLFGCLFNWFVVARVSNRVGGYASATAAEFACVPARAHACSRYVEWFVRWLLGWRRCCSLGWLTGR